MISRDRGLVLRIVRFGESSVIFSVLTAAHGRLRLVAHGARAARSRWAAALQPGNEVDVVYTLRPGRDLGHAREAALLQARLGGLRQLDAIGVGWAVLELLERLLPEGAAEAGVLDDAIDVFAGMADCRRREAALLFLYAFELRLLSRLGHAGPLDRCGSCGSARGGGWLEVDQATRRCERCGHTGLRLGPDVSEVLTRLVQSPWLEDAGTAPDVCRQLGVAVHRLCEEHLQGYRVPAGLQFLRRPVAASDPGSLSSRFS